MLCQVWPAAASLHSLCQLSGSQGSGGPPGCCRRRKLEFLTIVLKQFPGLLPIPTWWSSVMWKISTCYSELGGLGRWLPSLRTSMESLGCSRKQLGCIRQQCTWLYLPFFESSKVSKHQVKKSCATSASSGSTWSPCSSWTPKGCRSLWQGGGSTSAWFEGILDKTNHDEHIQTWQIWFYSFWHIVWNFQLPLFLNWVYYYLRDVVRSTIKSDADLQKFLEGSLTAIERGWVEGQPEISWYSPQL